MSIEVKEVLLSDKVVDPNGGATLELVEIIQRLAASNRDLQARVTALEAFHP